MLSLYNSFFLLNKKDKKNETGEPYYQYFSYNYRYFFLYFNTALNAMTQNPFLLGQKVFITILYYKLVVFS